MTGRYPSGRAWASCASCSRILASSISRVATCSAKSQYRTVTTIRVQQPLQQGLVGVSVYLEVRPLVGVRRHDAELPTR